MNESPEVTFVPLTVRTAQVDKNSWWDVEESLDYGAGPLVYRCMREYYWAKDYALRVLKGYRQFLELKKILEDWDAKILTPSAPVYQIWHQHMLDVTNYCHDCLLICGRVVGNDPDAALDEWAQEKRITATRQLLRARFERHIDPDIWNFDEKVATYARTVPRPTPSICMSGLTADEKNASGYEDGRGKFKNMNSHGMSMSSGKYQSKRSAAMYDEKKDDFSDHSRRSTKKDTVLIHDVHNGGDIEVEEDQDFHIRVRTLKGSIYSLTVNRAMSIAEVKEMIQELHGIPRETQHLLFYGKVLEDHKTLGQHSVPPESGLQLLVRSQRPLDMQAL